MVGKSNQNVFLIEIDASRFTEFEISEFEISRFDCILRDFQYFFLLEESIFLPHFTDDACIISCYPTPSAGFI